MAQTYTTTLNADGSITLKQAVPSLQALEIADRGHAPTLDEPVARQAIHAFLDRHNP